MVARGRPGGLPWLIVFFLLLPTAAAHVIQITGVTVRIDPQRTTVAVTAHLPLLANQDPAAAIARRLKLRLDDALFHPITASLTRDPAGDTVTWEAREDRAAGSVKLDAPIFPDVPGDTTVVMVYRNGQLTGRAALTPQRPAAVLGENTTAVIRRFIEMGIAHILSGPDHVLFVLGLILAGGNFRRLLAIVSAFTLAHSITLSLTALDIASLSPRIVEPMIAFSILVVGIENLVSGKPRFELRVAMAFGFGFFHGFGFAGALTEAGLPRQAIAWSLAAFNIGVEIGQALIVALTAPVLSWLEQSYPRLRIQVVRYAALGIALAGAIWFVQRVFA
jgi:hydrogenase/urease accessory protein HupE